RVPNARGLVLGICAGGFGAGSVFVTPIQTALINPDNIKPNNVTHFFDDEKLLQRVPKSLAIVGAILAGIQLIGFICVQSQSTMYTLEERDQSPETYAFETYEPSKTLETVEFYVLWVLMLCGTFPMVLIMSLYKIIGQRDIHNDQFLVTVGSLASAANMIGRVMWGELADKIAYRVRCVWGVLLQTTHFYLVDTHHGRFCAVGRNADWPAVLTACPAHWNVRLCPPSNPHVPVRRRTPRSASLRCAQTVWPGVLRC
uniref:MFS domain-containing protein n=1 Tax=Mesocestoides corti TaxID=53468 RepID=A0A5K3FRM4_MESCO